MSIGKVQTDNGWEYQVTVDQHAIEQLLGQIAPKINRGSTNARFYFDDATRQLVIVQDHPAVSGRTLDVAATRDANCPGDFSRRAYHSSGFE